MDDCEATCFTPVERSRPWKDNLGRKVGRCVLQQALKLAREQRWVAEWLFPTADGGKHPPLPPEAFEHALAVQMNHSLSAPDYSRYTHEVSKIFQAQSQNLIMRKDVNMLIVPVAAVGKMTAGYTFCTGHQYTQMTGHQPVTHTAGHYIMSRFVYDMQSRQFLAVSPMLADDVVGILQIIFHCDGSLERNIIIVPFLHYSADSLPSVVISSQCNLETRDLTSDPVNFQFEDKPEPKNVSEMNGSMEDLLHELTSLQQPFSPTDNIPLDFGVGDPAFDGFVNSSALETSTSDLAVVPVSPVPPPPRWLFSADGTTDDGVGVPRKPGNAPTSSGAFDMTAMTRSLAKLERHMKGSFFCLRAKRDIIDPNTGELLNRQTGQQISSCISLGKMETIKLREMATQTYYASVLSPAVDGRLVTSSVTAAAEQLLSPNNMWSSFLNTGKDLSSVISTSNSSALSLSTGQTVAPPTMSHTLAPRPVVHEEKKPKEVAKGAVLGAIDKTEAKKIRNRLSAARSNQRRRKQLEAQKRELEILQQRVIDLKRKKESMTMENQRLRLQFLDSAIGELS